MDDLSQGKPRRRIGGCVVGEPEERDRESRDVERSCRDEDLIWDCLELQTNPRGSGLFERQAEK